MIKTHRMFSVDEGGSLLGGVSATGSTEGISTSSWADIGVLFSSVSISVILRVGLSGYTDTSATTWTIVNNFSLLLHCDWDNLWWEVEVFPKVFDTFVGQYPVKVSPRKLLLEEASRR